MRRICDKCNKPADQHGLMEYDGQQLCWWCWKAQDLKDQRDWEDDDVQDS